MGLTETSFHQALPMLLLDGFPKPNSFTGNYDLLAIEHYLNRVGGLLKTSTVAADPADGFQERLALLG